MGRKTYISVTVRVPASLWTRFVSAVHLLGSTPDRIVEVLVAKWMEQQRIPLEEVARGGSD
jgi:antitoxin component of RelBE/YafQ-DinJ toxin-antitoxin module